MNESRITEKEKVKETTQIRVVLGDLGRRTEDLNSIASRLSAVTMRLAGHTCNLDSDEKSQSLPENAVHEFKIRLDDQKDIISRIENLLGRLEEVV